MLKCCCFWNKNDNNMNFPNKIIKSTSSKISNEKNEKKELFKIVKIENNNSRNSKIININHKTEETPISQNSMSFSEKIVSRNKKKSINQFLTQSPCQKIKFSYFDDENKASKNEKVNLTKEDKKKLELINSPIKQKKVIKFNLEGKKNIKRQSKGKITKTVKSEKLGDIDKKHLKLSLPNLNKFNHRLSVMDLGTFHLNTIKKSIKSSSILGFFEKNESINEINVVSFLSKSFKFLTREDLMEITYIKNLKNITDENSCIDKEGKGEINLYLENVKGKILLEKLIIGPLGLIEKSRRNAKDTITFFGYSEIKNYNDYILNNTSFIYNNKTFTKTLFAISYDLNCKKYFIQPILDHNKHGRFILIDISKKNFFFINNKAIMLNNSIIQIMPSNNENHHNLVYNLNLRILENNADFADNILINNIENGKEITIGYKDGNLIKLKYNKKLNKETNCSIIFDKERELWTLKGNNIWLVLDHKFSLDNETLVKIGEDIFKINVL